MIIRVARSGGFTGMSLQAVIDSEQLDPQERQELEKLVESSGFFERDLEAGSGQTGADRFHYELAIESGEQQRSVEFDEGQIPANWQPLIQQIDLLARRFRI